MLYVWKRKYGGLGVADIGRLRQLEEENQRFKKLLADLSLDEHILQEVLAERRKPARRRELAEGMQATFEVSQRRAGGRSQVQRSTCRHPSHKPDQTALTMRLKELAAARVRFGCLRLARLLQRESRAFGKRRVYRQENLLVRTKVRPKRAAGIRVPLNTAARVNQRWSSEFRCDRLTVGRVFHVWTIIDQYHRGARFWKSIDL